MKLNPRQRALFWCAALHEYLSCVEDLLECDPPKLAAAESLWHERVLPAVEKLGDLIKEAM